MDGLHKMDTERISKVGKTENWVELMNVEKIIVLEWRLSEMGVNICLEDRERKMRLKRMWKLIPQAGKKKRNKMTGGE